MRMQKPSKESSLELRHLFFCALLIFHINLVPLISLLRLPWLLMCFMMLKMSFNCAAALPCLQGAPPPLHLGAVGSFSLQQLQRFMVDSHGGYEIHSLQLSGTKWFVAIPVLKLACQGTDTDLNRRDECLVPGLDGSKRGVRLCRLCQM